MLQAQTQSAGIKYFVKKSGGNEIMDKKIVFCGCGNMGEGILKCVLNKNVVKPENVTISETISDRCKYLNETYHVAAVTDAACAIETCNMVVIAVVPKVVSTITSVIRNLISTDTIVLSVAAGVTLSALEEQLGNDKKIIRVMPNTLGESGNGFSAVCVNDNVSAADKDSAVEFLGALGQTMFLQENMFSAFTAFSCSGPMWFYKMAEEMINAGVYAGFSRNDAREIVIKNMLGAATVLDMTGLHPALKVDAMCSPGGVTIEGFKALNEGGFGPAIMDSVAKAVDKAGRVG